MSKGLTHKQSDKCLHAHTARPFYQLFQRLLEGGSLVLVQPELGVVGVADECSALVQIVVDDGVVSLVPVLQCSVYSLHQVVHHSPISRITDEQDLRENRNHAITVFQSHHRLQKL